MEMKESGIRWVGQVPTHWENYKIKACLKLLTDYDANGSFKSIADNVRVNEGEPYAWMVRATDLENGNYGISLDTNYCDKESYDFLSKSSLNAGDLIMAKRGGIGNVYVMPSVDVPATLAPNTYLLRFDTRLINTKYMYYVFKTDIGIEQLKLINKSTTIGAIYKEDVKSLVFSKPPIEEQNKIVKYLDEKCGEIEKLISEINEQIEILEKYHKAVITEAVTRGVNAKSDLKNCGIDWIGEIPSHWNTIKIKNIAHLKGRIGWQGLKSTEYQEEGPYLITGTDFCNGTISWNTCVHISEQRFDEDKLLHIKEGDLLITKDGTIGKVSIVSECPDQVTLNSGVMYIRSNGIIDYYNRFLYYVLLSDVFWGWYESNQRGNSTIRHLYQEQFYNFSFAYPDIDEQRLIVDYLDQKCEEIDSVIKLKKQQIETLSQYKKSMIYEYVTGKKEVS